MASSRLIATAAAFAVAGVPATTLADVPSGLSQWANPQVPEYKQLLEVLRQGNAAEIRKYLHDPFEYGGVWFEDKGCRQRFRGLDAIAEPDFDAFAACLSKLNFVLSDRSHPAGGLVVAYDPGIEIEVELHRARNSSWFIGSIGFVNRHDRADAAPTVHPLTLEASRLTGKPDAALAAADAEALAGADAGAYAWLKVCVDSSGKVSTTSPRAASSRAAVLAYAARVRDWTFKPVKLGGVTADVCSMYRLGPSPYDWQNELPTSAFRISSSTLMVSMSELEAHRLSGTSHIAPDHGSTLPPAFAALEAELPADTRWLHGAFDVQIDAQGHTSSVSIVLGTGDPSFDRKIEKELRRWSFEPYVVDGQPIAISTPVHISWGKPQPTILPARP